MWSQTVLFSGHFLHTFGEPGRGGGFLSPKGITIDTNQNVLVADYGNNRVSMFNNRGQFMKDILTEKDGIQCPVGLAIHSDKGLLAVSMSSETEHGSVKIFQLCNQDQCQ